MWQDLLCFLLLFSSTVWQFPMLTTVCKISIFQNLTKITGVRYIGVKNWQINKIQASNWYNSTIYTYGWYIACYCSCLTFKWPKRKVSYNTTILIVKKIRNFNFWRFIPPHLEMVSYKSRYRKTALCVYKDEGR